MTQPDITYDSEGNRIKYVGPEEVMLRLALAGKTNKCSLFEFANRNFGINLTSDELARTISNDDTIVL